MITVMPLQAADRARWDILARGYKTFYETVLSDAQYDETWQRILREDAVYGFGAHLAGNLVGIAHYMFHTSAWSTDACYLQDLFVDEAVRGQGVARTASSNRWPKRRAHAVRPASIGSRTRTIRRRAHSTTRLGNTKALSVMIILCHS